MFWRRKKVDTDETRPSQRLVQEYNADQVANALLGHYDDQEGDYTDEDVQSNSAVNANSTANTIVSEASEDEFYFEADAEDTQAPVAAAPAPVAQTISTLMSSLTSASPTESSPAQRSDESTPESTAPETVETAVDAREVADLVAALATTPAAPGAAVPKPQPLPVSNMDWPLEALRGVPLSAPAVAEALAADWVNNGLLLVESDTLRLIRNVVLRVPLLLQATKDQQEFWGFVYPEANAEAAAHFVAVERKANLFGAVAVYFAPSALELSGVQPATLPNELELSLARWPEERPFPQGDYALWWPNASGEHLSNSEEGRLLTRVFTLQDEAASLLYGLMATQLQWAMPEEGSQPASLRRALPEKTQYLNVMDSKGHPMILSASQDKGVRLHLLRNPESEQMRRYWLEQTEQLLKILVSLLLSAQQPLDTLWHDYETRPSQWWKAAQQVLDLRLEIGDDLSSILVGNVRDELEQAAELG